MKKLIILFCLSTSFVKAADTVFTYVPPIPTMITLIACYDTAGREVPTGTNGLTIWLLSDGTIRKFYR